MEKLQRTAGTRLHVMYVLVGLAPVFHAIAANGRLLNRTELRIPADVLKSGRTSPQLSNAIQRARFWKFTYEGDGLKVCGYMAGPRAPGPHPCIIDNRGGNRDFGVWTDTNCFRWFARLASEGYFIMASNYRGSPGSEGQDEFGGADVNDILNLFPLIDALKEEIDPARIGTRGWSRGGMMTYLALCRTKRIAAAVVGSGVVDLNEMIEQRPEMETDVIGQLVPGYRTNKVEGWWLRDRRFWLRSVNARTRSASGKYRAEAGFGQDAGDFCALISLNLDSSFLNRAARAASFLHSFAELLLFRQTDAYEARNDSHGLAAAMGRLPQDVDPTPVLRRNGNCGRRLAARLAGLVDGRWRQPRAAQAFERIVRKALAAIDGNAFFAAHLDILYSKCGGGKSGILFWIYDLRFRQARHRINC